MNSAILKKTELQANSFATAFPFSRQRGLMAQWQMENGKLVCKWVNA